MIVSFYTFARSVVNGIFRPLFRVKAVGQENLPKEGGVLLCSNHIHNFDPILLGINIDRQVHFMAKKELFSGPVLKKIFTSLGAFPVRRGMSDREALRTGLKVLKEGHVMGLFPEGTRSKTGELGKPLAGAGFFALRTEAAVVPCAVVGSYKPFSRMTVIYGEPIDMSQLRKNKASADEAAEHIMNEIKKLIDTHKMKDF